MKNLPPTPIKGIRYYFPVTEGVLTGHDGKVRGSYGDLPVPLIEEDFELLDGGPPSYDAVGRGIYQALRSNPDCVFGRSYAELLQEAYPHFLGELASQLLMLDKKDVDVAYLDRKITCLKIFALIEPENPQLHLEVGKSLLDRGMSLAATQMVTITLYQAERFLRKVLSLSPDGAEVRHYLAEVSYLLGRYDDAASIWRETLAEAGESTGEKLRERIARLETGKTPLVPVVDYLEATGVAFDYYQRGEFAEAAAILHDIIDDEVLREEYAMPQFWYVLGSCYAGMGMRSDAEKHLLEALRLDPDYTEAQSALKLL
jgi:tetratricopeptide (TPR) repeat protein